MIVFKILAFIILLPIFIFSAIFSWSFGYYSILAIKDYMKEDKDLNFIDAFAKFFLEYIIY